MSEFALFIVVCIALSLLERIERLEKKGKD